MMPLPEKNNRNWAIKALQDWVQDIDYLNFGGNSPAPKHVLLTRPEDLTEEELAEMRPGATIARKSYEHVRSQ